MVESQIKLEKREEEKKTRGKKKVIPEIKSKRRKK